VGLWDYYYINDRGTRELPHPLADVVKVAADVSGVVTEVKLRTTKNRAPGHVLFIIDKDRIKLSPASQAEDAGPRPIRKVFPRTSAA